MVCCYQMSQNVEIVSNLGPNIFWLKVRTKGLRPSICVQTFSQFTMCIGLPLRDILRARRAMLSACMIQDEEIYETTALFSRGCVYQSTVRREPTGRLSQCERPSLGNDAGTR